MDKRLRSAGSIRLAKGYVSLFLLIALGTLHARELRVGIYQNEPKVFMDAQGRPAGFFPELLERVADVEGWELTYVPCEWAACLDALARGELDLMPDVAYTEARAEQLSFGKVPVLYGWIQVYCQPQLELRSPLDLGGRRLAILQNSVQEHALTNLLFGFGLRADLVRCPSFDSAFQAVAERRADAVLVNRFFGERHYAQYGLKPTDIMFYPSPLFFATPRDKHLDVLNAIDRHVEAWKKDANSAYYVLLRKWLQSEPVFTIPRKIRWALIMAFASLLVAGLVAVLLKWEVNQKTRELQAKNRKLEEALAELNRLQEEALKQERLHALGQMASGIAHDFNNILSVILSYAEMIELTLKDSPACEKVREDLEVIVRAAKDGAQVVRRMREFYAATEAEHEMMPVSVNEMLNSTLVLSQPKWDTQARSRGIKIHTRTVFGEVPRVMGNEAELRQAFINILINAIDAMPKGGDLILRTCRQDDLVIIEIEDTGDGMSPEVLANCTRPFYTTKGAKGSGLGLPMVAATVSRHGGRLRISSEPGRGTCVRVELPALTGDLAATSTAHQLIPIRPLQILLLDDDPVFIKAVSTLLVKEGHRVDAVMKPLEALEKITACAYDVMLCDLAMPEMSGLQVVELLRSHGCKIPIVMITGTLESLNDTAAALPGVIHFLSKPFSIQRLNKVLASLGFRAV